MCPRDRGGSASRQQEPEPGAASRELVIGARAENGVDRLACSREPLARSAFDE
jgi:hypothetical protein